MMKKIQLLFLILSLCFVTGCQKDVELEKKDYPFVYISCVESQEGESLTIKAKVLFDDHETIIDHGFIIEDRALNSSFQQKIEENYGEMQKGNNEFSITFTDGLHYHMYYSVVAFTQTASVTVYSPVELIQSSVHYYNKD
ncbi:hypothetical protein ACE1ET_14090 [Saccharicrinis sp. FJH62]|uniref:hypothetical protein n=1 Tax=Saccharicrinis sp. FJH62 TaxID=3344657 RepID=UPI0035D512E7